MIKAIRLYLFVIALVSSKLLFSVNSNISHSKVINPFHTDKVFYKANLWTIVCDSKTIDCFEEEEYNDSELDYHVHLLETNTSNTPILFSINDSFWLLYKVLKNNSHCINSIFNQSKHILTSVLII